MKTGIVVSGIVILVIDLAAWLLIESFSGFNATLVAASIIVTVAMQLLVIAIEYADAYRIVLSSFLGVTGLLRIALCAAASRTLGLNIIAYAIILLLALEVLSLTWVFVASRFHGKPKSEV